jgi:hypothetical protein
MPEFSNRFGNHFDRTARTFFSAEFATLAIVVVEYEPFAWPELDDRVVGTDAVAVVAFEAIATRKASARLVERVRFIEPTDHLLKVFRRRRTLGPRPSALLRCSLMDDEDTYRAFFVRATPEDFRLRSSATLSHRFIDRLTQIDYTCAIPLVAIDPSAVKYSVSSCNCVRTPSTTESNTPSWCASTSGTSGSDGD